MARTSPLPKNIPAPIGRDHPRRFVEVKFFGGAQQTGFPLPPPAPERVKQLNPVQLIQAFTISPRQAALIAALAGGRSRRLSAERLGMAQRHGGIEDYLRENEYTFSGRPYRARMWCW